MQADLGAFQERGARVVAVGMGTGDEAAAVRDDLELGFDVLGDPGHAGYDALGLARDGWFNLIGRPLLERPLSAVRDIADADLKASVSPRSDVKRLGGAAIVDGEGTLRYLRRARRSDDLPSNAALLAAIDAL